MLLKHVRVPVRDVGHQISSGRRHRLLGKRARRSLSSRSLASTSPRVSGADRPREPDQPLRVRFPPRARGGAAAGRVGTPSTACSRELVPRRPGPHQRGALFPDILGRLKPSGMDAAGRSPRGHLEFYGPERSIPCAPGRERGGGGQGSDGPAAPQPSLSAGRPLRTVSSWRWHFRGVLWRSHSDSWTAARKGRQPAPPSSHQGRLHSRRRGPQGAGPPRGGACRPPRPRTVPSVLTKELKNGDAKEVGQVITV